MILFYLYFVQNIIRLIWFDIGRNGYDDVAITVVGDVDSATRNMNRQAAKEQQKEKTIMTDHHGHVVVILVTCSTVNTNDVLKKLHFLNGLCTRNLTEKKIGFTILR